MDPGHYVSWVKCDDETWVCGTGPTAKESEASAANSASNKNKFLSSSARERLRSLLKQTPKGGYLLAHDTTQAIRAIAEILGIET